MAGWVSVIGGDPGGDVSPPTVIVNIILHGQKCVRQGFQNRPDICVPLCILKTSYYVPACEKDGKTSLWGEGAWKIICNFPVSPPRNYSLKFDCVLSPPTTK